MKRAFFVTGPPSSGTRLMVRLLVAAGCAGDGDDLYYQRWNEQTPEGDLIVFRRHMPQPVDRPPWSGPNVINSLQRLGYTVNVVIMTRDWHCSTGSHIEEGYTDNPAFSRLWLRTLWRQLFQQLPADVDFEVVSYESLTQRPSKTIPALMSRLGLDPFSDFEEITDGNEKHYAAKKKRGAKK